MSRTSKRKQSRPAASRRQPRVFAKRVRGWLRRPVVVVLLLATLTASVLAADWYLALPADAGAHATYVGGAKCAQCHQDEHRAWLGSHHDRAMDLATADSVLGDFDDTEFTYQGVSSRFFRKDGSYWVHAEGPDGQHHDYQIKYTFGVDPLQQYMVEFPDGRVQVLRTSWDTKEKRWFYVPPPDARDERILPDDPMHWTGPSQNWNHTCAECHSTNYHKNYDFDTDTYRSSFSEIDVSCEACHGPGSLHVELADSYSLFWDRRHGYGLAKLKGQDPSNELATCATCHARRGAVHPDFRPGRNFLDFYDLTLLLPGLYHFDGQIQDEVYVYGSFLQSKMHANGVRCTDCHNPHSLKLKFADNRLCTDCHQHEAAKYDTPSHHHHPEGTEGASCVECHMPAEVYMEVDARRDHSFRIPRPDLTIAHGTPNACNSCHTKDEETPQWAAAKIEEWYGDSDRTLPHFASAFAQAATGDESAEAALVQVAAARNELPAVVRATAVTLLGGYGGTASNAARRKALYDTEPLVRLAAIRALPPLDSPKTFRRLAELLSDPTRIIRTAAARQLAPLRASPPGQARLSRPQTIALDAALKEYRVAQELALDRAASHLNLGDLAERLGNLDEASIEYRRAIKVEPYFTGPRSLLGNVLEQQKGNLAVRPAPAAQIKRVDAEIRRLREHEVELLARDVQLVPDNAELRYRHGTMLFLLGRVQQSQLEIQEACRLYPSSYPYRLFLTLLHERRRQWDQAIQSLHVLEQLRPGDPEVQALRQRIEAGKARAR